MASAYRDMAAALAGRPETGWRASFRRLNSRPGQAPRRVAIPREALAAADDVKAAADAWAAECERLCRLLERRVSPDPELIDRAEAHRAISPEDAQALRDALPPNLQPRRPPTLADAARAHPSSLREADSDPAGHARHLRELAEFEAFAGLDRLADLRLEHATAWVQAMRRDGLAWDTRRHRLLFLRRAAMMGARWGVAPDPLAGLKLDPAPTRRAPIDVLRAEELRAAAAALEAAGDWRALAALGLGALAGLRPSEMIRAQVGDLSGGVLSVGEREQKNAASIRELPLAASAARWCALATEGRPPESAILAPLDGRGRAKAGPFDRRSWARWVRRFFARSIGREVAPKNLRKSFATLAIRAGAPVVLVESYMGHQVAGAGDALARSYLQTARARELQPIADTMEALLREPARLTRGVSPSPET